MTITTVTANNSANSSDEGCPIQLRSFYPSIFGIQLAVPDWEAISTTIILSLIIIFTIIGNVLVILSVFTYKPLRIVQNFFIVSLAVADLTVAILVLPFNVAYSILGKWEFGIGLCKMWLTCDVLCCTSSILNLCAIALDRYWAITDPINYAQKRTVERVLLLIAGVWILSLLISSPPLIGWNDWPIEFTSDTPCQLTSQKGYVIYSSLGSFYIPLFIMAIVYIEIFIATRRRLRERAQASKINAMALRGKGDNNDPLLKQNQLNSKFQNDRPNNNTTVHEDQDSISSETNHNEHPNVSDAIANQKHLDKQNKRNSKQKQQLQQKQQQQKQQQKNRIQIPIDHEDSVTDNNLHENSSDSLTLKQNSGNHDDSLENEELNNCDRIEKLDLNTKILIDTKLDDARLLKQQQQQQHKNRKFKKKRSIKRTGGVYQFIEEKQKISLSKERRAARTLGIIMGVFVICWLPFFLMYVILPFCSTCCPTDKFINFITWLGYINSALNPIIYTIFNLEYRRAFKRLLGIKF